MPTSFQFIFLFLIWKWKVKKVAQKNQSNSTLWNGSEWQKGEKKQKKRRERGFELIWKRIYWQDTSRQLIALLEHHISYPAAAKQERERVHLLLHQNGQKSNHTHSNNGIHISYTVNFNSIQLLTQYPTLFHTTESRENLSFASANALKGPKHQLFIIWKKIKV